MNSATFARWVIAAPITLIEVIEQIKTQIPIEYHVDILKIIFSDSKIITNPRAAKFTCDAIIKIHQNDSLNDTNRDILYLISPDYLGYFVNTLLLLNEASASYDSGELKKFILSNNRNALYLFDILTRCKEANILSATNCHLLLENAAFIDLIHAKIKPGLFASLFNQKVFDEVIKDMHIKTPGLKIQGTFFQKSYD